MLTGNNFANTLTGGGGTDTLLGGPATTPMSLENGADGIVEAAARHDTDHLDASAAASPRYTTVEN